jgi:ribonuclease BN (tRNA processing enzyme)
MHSVYPIPAFNDNYIWAIVDADDKYAAVVDPGEATPVIEFLEQRKLKLSHILVTHHHNDHTAGIPELLDYQVVPVTRTNNLNNSTEIHLSAQKIILQALPVSSPNVRVTTSRSAPKYHNSNNQTFGQDSWQQFRNNQQERISITGGRSIGDKIALRDQLADEMYSNIRNSKDDIQKIAKNLSMPEFQIRRIKEHIFYNTHQLDHGLGVRRFHADLEIATAWKNMEAGIHIETDLLILKHEHFESRFEGIFKTDYRTAHDAADRAGHPSGLQDIYDFGFDFKNLMGRQ